MAWLGCLSGSVASATPPAPSAQVFVYDGHHQGPDPRHTITERGPPATPVATARHFVDVLDEIGIKRDPVITAPEPPPA